MMKFFHTTSSKCVILLVVLITCWSSQTTVKTTVEAWSSNGPATVSTRREWFSKAGTVAAAASAAATTSTATTTITAGTFPLVMSTAATTAVLVPQPAHAAPPFAIMAEELGYFPVTNSAGETVYIPKQIARSSSKQAIQLAYHLNSISAKVYETYWCPHSARQRELFGREAWAILNKGSTSSSTTMTSTASATVECSPKGYRAKPALCIKEKVDGYPTWNIKNKFYPGEQSLQTLAQVSQYPGTFRESLELNVPPPLGSQTCQLKK